MTQNSSGVTIPARYLVTGSVDSAADRFLERVRALSSVKDNKLQPHVCSSSKIYFPASPRTFTNASIKVLRSRTLFGPLSPSTLTRACSHET